MAAISGAIPNVIGGVSQQPPEIRAINTSANLVNSVCDVATGLHTRPAAQYVGNLSARPAGNNTVADLTLQKPSGNYKIVVHGGQIFVQNLDTGLNEPVTVQGAAGAYINIANAAKHIRFVPVGDFVFIYNTATLVTATVVDETGVTGLLDDGTLRRNPNRYGTYWVKQRAGYNANYAIYVNGTRRTLVTTSSLTPAEIASQLGAIAGYTVTAPSETVRSVLLNAETDFINSHDDFANEAVMAFNDNVDEFTDLPNFDIEGRLVLIKQSRETAEDDYWVWYKGGEWKETFGWDAYEKPNDSTMPHVLVDNRNGTWTFRQHSWLGRKTGDADSNPTPTFIGRTINSMFLYKGRMCILSDENFIASQVGNYENFYRSTCTQLIDEDPIDISAPNSRGSKLLFSIEFDNKLIVTSSFEQFVIDGSSEGMLSPNTVSIKRANSYNFAAECEPVYVGPNFLFADDFQNRGYALLREYQVERVFGRQVALPVTDQVPEYVPSGVYKLASSASDDVVVVLSRSDRRSIWLYNYYYNNEGKVLSSWQRWEFNFDVHGASFLDDILLLTVAHDTDLYTVSIKFASGADSVLDSDSVLLDLRVHSSSLPKVFNGTNTTVTLPYDIESPSEFSKLVAVVSPTNSGSLAGGRQITPSSYGPGGQVVFNGIDLTAQEFLVGFKFRFEWELNPIYVRDRNLVAIQDGRLQLRNISFLYNNSGPFTAIVTPPGRSEYQDRFTGLFVGSSVTPMGSLKLSSGEFRTAAYGQGDQVVVKIVAETPWRVRFSSIEWDGAYRARKQRTT